MRGSPCEGRNPWADDFIKDLLVAEQPALVGHAEVSEALGAFEANSTTDFHHLRVEADASINFAASVVPFAAPPSKGSLTNLRRQRPPFIRYHLQGTLPASSP